MSWLKKAHLIKKINGYCIQTTVNIIGGSVAQPKKPSELSNPNKSVNWTSPLSILGCWVVYFIQFLVETHLI